MTTNRNFHSRNHSYNSSLQENFHDRYESFTSQNSSLSGLRSPSFCSTCTSSDDFSDSEEEDAASKWPWIDFIQDNGNLLYVLSFPERSTPIQKKTTQECIESIITNENKDRKIQEKIKSVIQRSRSFTKKDHLNLNNGPKHHHKKKNFDNDGKQDHKPAHIETKISDTMNLICRNVKVQLNEKVSSNFVGLENVLGIISGLDFDPVLDDFDNDILMSGYHGLKQNPNSIVVQGIIPNSPVGMANTVLIGDIILAVNGKEVDHYSLKDVLENINGDSEAVITIERLVPDLQNDQNKSRLCSVVSNKLTEENKVFFDASYEICGVILLTLSSTDENPDSDIVFWYPESDSSLKLKSIRGVFLTLSDVMESVTETLIQSSVVIVDEKLINICYEKIGDSILLVALPHEKCSLSKLSDYTREFVHSLELVYGETTSAFKDENIASTNHLASIFLDSMLKNEDWISLGIRELQLPISYYVDISNVLCDAESADYGECVDDFFPHRRLYGTVGTCLFYQDTLVCNHLSDANLKDMVTICRQQWLFKIAKQERLKQLVIWKEIHLTAAKQTDTKNDIDYEKPIGVRWFVLIVGQGKTLLCTLLEAGGVASIPEGNPGPHPYYVDTAWSILTYLIESLELEVMCQSKLSCGSSPAIVKPLEAINPKTSPSPRALELIKRKVPAHLVDRSSLLLNGSLFEHKRVSLDSSPDLNISNPLRQRRTSRDSSLSSGSVRNYNVDTISFKSVNLVTGSEVSLTSALSTKLTAGVSNTLFCFTTIKSPTNIFLSPKLDVSEEDCLTIDMLSNFKTCVEKIHCRFQSRKGFVRELEEGVLFHSQPTKGAEIKKGNPNIKYWVVGRLLIQGTNEEESYVCFQDGVPQNIVEMAFKMRYGCYY